MGLETGWQQALLDEIRGAAADDRRVVAVQAYGSVASGEADAWSDLDVAMRVVAGGANEIATTGWLSRFGRVWASDASANSFRSVIRVVYADGRRLDLTVADAGRAGPVTPLTLDRLAARTTRVRFTAALAVAKAARDDLLVATHLVLGLCRDCLELAILGRDQAAGTTLHRAGGPGNDLSARIAGLLPAGGGAAAVYTALDGVAAVYDELALGLDKTYRPDWSGLDALLARARGHTSAAGWAVPDDASPARTAGEVAPVGTGQGAPPAEAGVP